MRRTAAWAVAVAVLIASAPFVGRAAEASLDQLTKAGHFKRARVAVNAALKQSPRDAHLLMLMCRIARNFGNLDDAQRYGEQAIAADPKNWEAHWELGQVYADQINHVSFFKKMGLAGKIRAEFQAAVDNNPNSFEPHYALMSFYFEAPGMAGGDRKKAQEEQAIVARLKPAWGFLAQYDLTPKDKRASVQEELYRKAHDAAEPTDYQDLVPYCNFLVGAKRWAEAQTCGEDLVKRAPDRANGHSVLAVTFASQSRWPDLDRVIAEAEKDVPDNLNAEFQAARVLIETGGDPQRAERYLRRYLQQEPEAGYPKSSRAHYRLGQALAKQGRKPDAIAEFQTALKLEPDLKPAQDELKKLQ